MRGDRYQIVLIASGVVATLLFGLFFIRELFPEYKIYQDAYLKLEEFRTSYTGQPMPPFKGGIKQIVIEPKDRGPAEVDRCTSCHVALQFQHFSPTQLAKDINGNILLDEAGTPVKEPNPSYIWTKVDEKIAALNNPESPLYNPSDAEELEELKVARVGEHIYSMSKVLQMHPLIGRETRPFEYHSIDEYGCTSCHSGNGRGLTTEKAHGPVFDGHYEEADMGPVPRFTEPDPENDPAFSRVFNHKPGHELLFQTTPILVGGLMDSKCMQCHQTSSHQLERAATSGGSVLSDLKEKSQSIKQSYNNDLNALVDLIQLRASVNSIGVAETVKQLRLDIENYRLSPSRRDLLSKQATLLTAMVGGPDGLRPENAQPALDVANEKIENMVADQLGSKELAQELFKQVDPEGVDAAEMVNQFLDEKRQHPEASGRLFKKADNLDLHQKLFQKADQNQEAFRDAVLEMNNLDVAATQVDQLTKNYQEGERLFISQACYPCHRIAGLSRGGVGPDLTEIGNYYPWYIKESIVWPQADLKTSTMPNFRLDHEQLEDLVTFLLAQKGQSRAVSESDYKASVAAWEAGKKMAWEKPVSPADMHDLDYSMTVFATEGCAACHRLKGYQSNIGFKKEKEKASFDALYKEREWFRRTIPEMISGSDLVRAIESHQNEIDARIVDDVRENALLDRIDAKLPGNTESFYSNFAFAKRAKNSEFKDQPDVLLNWKKRVRRVLMMYVQEYGLGRLIGPKPNWSGVYRSDEWLMEHFRKPSALVARSIMPVFPFDETKFYALTHMLNALGAKNRDENRKVWDERGFNPEAAYDLYCAQCHGNQRIGNGPVSEWIYPVPKNLRNADFMRNLTPERARHSLIHGIKGGPMPPWGEAPMKPTTKGVPVLTEAEIDSLVDWLYNGLPGGSTFQEEGVTPKWKYDVEDVLKELEKEGSQLPEPLSMLPTGAGYFASLNPEVSQVFDAIPNPEGDPDPYSYYIKKRFYTPENLAAGKAFFEVQCAVCHGRDGDGAGQRAGVMQDAKPRMLTNLDWLDSRDDLRLLRSLKYGVTGTSMQPWGDQTTSLLRLQLVMYIRTLSEQQKLRDQLYEALYKSFDEARFTIDDARIDSFPKITKLSNELKEVKSERQGIASKVKAGEVSPEAAAALYQKQLEIATQLKQQEEVDINLNEIKESVLKEKALFEEVGLGIISQDSDLLPTYISIINLHGNPFSLNNGVLSFQPTIWKKEWKQELEEALNQKLVKLQDQKVALEGRITSADQKEKLKDINTKIEGLSKVRLNLLSTIEESKRLQQRQQELVTNYKEKQND